MSRDVDVPSLLAALRIPVVRKAGEAYWCCCPSPDHLERTPSWFMRERPGDRFHASFHCFSAETMVMTFDGPKPIGGLNGRWVELLTATEAGAPRWVNAPIRSFGRQELWRVTLSRNGVRKVVRATAGHRWFVHHQGVKLFERTTEQLRVGHRLRSVTPPRSGVVSVSPWGVAHGFTFGDGTRIGTGECQAYLWGEKDAALRKFFPLSPTWENVTDGGVPGILVRNLPGFFKSLPSLEETPSYLYGWLAGYFAADGCVDESGVPSMASATREYLEFVERLCLRLGVFTYGIRRQERVGYGDGPSEIFSLTFRRSALSEDFFITDEHRRRWLANPLVRERLRWSVVSVERTGEVEEVFCAVVPETHAFALEGNILTGNCFGCEFAGWPVQLVQKMLGFKTQREAFMWLRDMPIVEQPLPKHIEVVTIKPKTELQVPDGVEFAPFAEWPARYREYLEGRRVVEQATAWGLGFVRTSATDDNGEPHPLAGRIWIPAHDAGGRLLSYTARAIGAAKRRYREPYAKEGASPAAIFGELRWPVLDRKRVVVTEGAFNAMAVERVAPGLPVAALMGSSLDPLQVLKLTRFETVLLALDPDKAGIKARAQLRGALARYVKIVDIAIPAGQDCDSLPAEQLGALVHQALA